MRAASVATTNRRMTDSRELDVVVFGATGFTGRLAAEYLATRAHAEGLRWALAGRSKGKLEDVRRGLGEDAKDVPLIEARVDDPASLAKMAARTRVLLTTVGPYAQYGDPVVDACVAEGTDYVDITGEPAFVGGVIARHHETAKQKGLRIVSCCGFDSIPHDLGVFHAMRALAPKGAATAEAFVRSGGGTFSGGTWHSAIGAMSRLREDRKHLAPPRAEGSRRVRGMPMRIHYEPRLGLWACPLPTIDPQIVLRSARELPLYGPDFRYGHYAGIRKTATLVGGIVGVSALVALSQLGPTRDLLLRVRDPGDGPDAEHRARAWFEVTILAESDGRTVRAKVGGGDPGYGETAKMVAESALCLAKDRARLPGPTGVLTTAVAMGEPLVERLVRAGLRFSVEGLRRLSAFSSQPSAPRRRSTEPASRSSQTRSDTRVYSAKASARRSIREARSSFL